LDVTDPDEADRDPRREVAGEVAGAKREPVAACRERPSEELPAPAQEAALDIRPQLAAWMSVHVQERPRLLADAVADVNDLAAEVAVRREDARPQRDERDTGRD